MSHKESRTAAVFTSYERSTRGSREVSEMLLLCPSQKLRKDYRKEIRSADKSDETKHSAARDVMASLRSRADPEEDASLRTRWWAAARLRP